jgi:hypothetical protein
VLEPSDWYVILSLTCQVLYHACANTRHQATTTTTSAEAATPSPACTQAQTEKCRRSRASPRSRPLLQLQPVTARARQHHRRRRLSRARARRPPVLLLRRPRAAQVLHREARLHLRALRARLQRKARVRRRVLLRRHRQVLRCLRLIDAVECWLHWRCRSFWL